MNSSITGNSFSSPKNFPGAMRPTLRQTTSNQNVNVPAAALGKPKKHAGAANFNAMKLKSIRGAHHYPNGAFDTDEMSKSILNMTTNAMKIQTSTSASKVAVLPGADGQSLMHLQAGSNNKIQRKLTKPKNPYLKIAALHKPELGMPIPVPMNQNPIPKIALPDDRLARGNAVPAGQNDRNATMMVTNSQNFHTQAASTSYGDITHKKKLIEILKKANQDPFDFSTEENAAALTGPQSQPLIKRALPGPVITVAQGTSPEEVPSGPQTTKATKVGEGIKFRLGTPSSAKNGKKPVIGSFFPPNGTVGNNATLPSEQKQDDIKTAVVAQGPLSNSTSFFAASAKGTATKSSMIPTEPARKNTYETKEAYLLTKYEDNELDNANEAPHDFGGDNSGHGADSAGAWENLELPLRPSHVLASLHAKHLTEDERKEILEYTEIYCIGHKAEAKRRPADSEWNKGYDDDKGDYMGSIGDHIAYRYELVDRLGRGSFGQVFKAYDYKNGEHVALKIIRNKEKFHRQAKIEMNILDYIRKNDPEEQSNLIIMRDNFTFRSHVIITFELLSANLYEFIKSNKFRGLTLNLLRRIAIQILQALSFMKRHKIIHCDLKPENILLKQPDRSGIKIIDLGSSCFDSEKLYTYIQSRYYRCPEVILGYSYDMAIDMWSFGCIIFELFTGFPCFPGESEKDQLQRIMEVLGKPDEHIINTCPRRSNFFDDKGEPYVTPDRKGRLHYPGAKNLEDLLQCDDPNFVDFIKKCMNWYPTRRLTPDQALVHEWIVSGLPTNLKSHHVQSVKAGLPFVAAITAKDEVSMMNRTHTQQIQAPPQQQQKSFKIKSSSNAIKSIHTVAAGGAADPIRNPYRNPGGLDFMNATKDKFRNVSQERSVDKSVNRKENSRFIEFSPQKAMKVATVTSPMAAALKNGQQTVDFGTINNEDGM